MKQDILFESKTRQLAEAARAVLASCEAEVLAAHDALSPLDAAQRVAEELNRCTDPAKIRELAEYLNYLRSPAAVAASVNVRGPILARFEQARKALLELADHLENRLRDALADAEHAEVEFFAAHNLPHEPTAVSKQAKTLIAQVQNGREQAAGMLNLAGVPVANQMALMHWCGVTDVANPVR